MLSSSPSRSDDSMSSLLSLSLSLSLYIYIYIHHTHQHSWKFLQITCCVHTELMYICFCWSSNIGVSKREHRL